MAEPMPSFDVVSELWAEGHRLLDLIDTALDQDFYGKAVDPLPSTHVGIWWQRLREQGNEFPALWQKLVQPDFGRHGSLHLFGAMDAGRLHDFVVANLAVLGRIA
jgi:hypothetical protein